LTGEEENPRIDEEILILQSHLPSLQTASASEKTSMPALKKRLKDALLNLHAEPEGQAVLRNSGP